MKKKIVILISLAFCLLLVGWGAKKTVDLLNDQKLIDLSLAIQDANIGTEGSQDGTEGREDGQDRGSEDGDGEDSETVPDPFQGQTHTISIRHKTILCDDVVRDNVGALRNYLVSACDRGDMVYLVDDYAEAHVYREVLALLDSLVKLEGIEYGEK